jgi:hypothetical protein
MLVRVLVIVTLKLARFNQIGFIGHGKEGDMLGVPPLNQD